MRILITGAASGIGYGVGCELARRGHLVYFTTHTVEQLYHLREKLKRDNIDGLCFKLDITTDDVFLVDKLKIDCLINHAAIGVGGSLLYMDMEGLREVYEVNIFSSFRLLKRVYQNMEKDKIAGKIFITSSILSMMSLPFLGCYASSKAAISSLAKTLRLELQYLKSNVQLSLIEPGAYHTGFNQVMIDNKSKYLEVDNKIYHQISSVNRLQRNLFAMLEKKEITGLVKKIVAEIEKDKSKFLIRVPWIQGFFAKLMFFFYH